MKKLVYGLTIATLAIALTACTAADNTKKDKAHDSHNMDNVDNKDHGSHGNGNSSSQKAGQLQTLNTKNVTRLSANNPYQASIMVSQTIWPSTHDDNKPGTVILTTMDKWQTALAGVDLIHHPNNGPVLYIDKENIPQEIMDEIKRLNPPGNKEGTQIMVMGDVDQKVLDQVQDYKVEQIKGKDEIEFAAKVDEKYAEVAGELPKGVIIVSSEDEAKLYSLTAANWIAHMPEPVLFVTKEEIPESTKKALENRKNKANIYILGPDKIISKDIEKELVQYGEVERISGDNPVSTSIAFAQFKDNETGFGWGVDEPGHGLNFVSTATPEYAVVSAPFAHLGKHAPMIWLEEGELAEATHEYLSELQPKFKDDPTVGPYNHAYILGSTKEVSIETQGMIDSMIEISPESGDGHSGH